MKKPVQFRPYIRTPQAFRKVRCCRKCGSYSIVWEDVCPVCGREELIALEDQAAHEARQSSFIDVWAIACIILAAIFLSRTITEMIVCFGTGIVLIAASRLLWSRASGSETQYRLHRLFMSRAPKIKEGLLRDSDSAFKDAMEDRKKEAYEKLREIGALLFYDEIKRGKLLLLNTFFLRKDMDLELDSLIVGGFDRNLADYMGEVAKLKRDLIKSNALQYAIRYEKNILSIENGEEILVHMAGAALRTTHYVNQYKDFIMRYMKKLPRERFLRLCKVVKSNGSPEWAELAGATKAVFNEKYHWDPEFQGIF